MPNLQGEQERHQDMRDTRDSGRERGRDR